uniref:Protein kinase domain-containing protein n=1 Tax=Mola mola TaxID=94237 RepID=A0A3Q3XMC1_MOLML
MDHGDPSDRVESTTDTMDYLLRHNITKGCLLGECHLLVDNLGEGGFGFVTRCFNIEKCKMEAVKILKSNPDLLCQARNELTILKQLRCLNPDTCNVVKLNDVFCHKDYICLALELLDQDLLDYVGERQGGLPMSEIRPIIHQLATALYHLSSIGIVHADIKPENVMLVDRSRQPLKVKLIDFGLAYPVHGKPCAVVQTVGYRAPEVMLDIPFDEAIDMWSLGVTAAELAAGFHPYAGNKDYDVLSLIIKYQGQPRDGLLDCGKKTGCYFNRQTNGQQRWRFKTPQELDMLPKLMDHGDPNDRIKPLEVLQHPFFSHIRQRPPVVNCIRTGTDSETPEVSPQSMSPSSTDRQKQASAILVRFANREQNIMFQLEMAKVHVFSVLFSFFSFFPHVMTF